MRVAVLGATGRTGHALVPELLARGHGVSALVRDPAALPRRTRLERLVAERLADGPASQQYAFRIHHAGVLLAEGRAAVVLAPTMPA